MGKKKNKENQYEMFCQEYIIDFCGKDAAIRAGYTATNASQVASKLISLPRIKNRIDELVKKRSERVRISADRIVQELEYMAMFDPKDLAGITSQAEIKELPESIRRAIVGWSYNKEGHFIIKMAKEKAIELLGRHHKLFTDSVEINDKTGLAARLEKAKQAKKG